MRDVALLLNHGILQKKNAVKKGDADMDESNPPHFRIWLCGAFRVERRVGRSYEIVLATEWGGSSYPLLLLKALLCSPGRQARRDSLLETLWPDTDPEQAARNLNTATTKLRKVLEPGKGQASLLITEEDSRLYRLETQSLLWVDVDAALTLLGEVERLGRTSPKTLSLLEETETLLSKGTLLQDEEGSWAAGRRATVEQARYQCRLWLAEAYAQHQMPGQAGMVLSLLFEEDPTDEDVLCRLMLLFHRQGMTHQALRLYQRACEIAEREESIEHPSSTLSKQPNVLSTRSPQKIAFAHEMGKVQQKSMLILPAPMMQTEKLEEVAHLDDATFFGLQLAQAVTLIHQWFGMASFCHELQNRLDQEIKKLDQLKTQDAFDAFTLSRRSFLTTLATLPIALLTSTQQKHKFVLVLEEVLPTCAASITACWHLSGGGHLDAISPILDSYLPTLVNICKHTSTHREMVADLVAQIYFLKAILAWHLEGLEEAETYCTQALSYSDLTKNTNLRLTALNQQALIAYYSKDFQRALQKSGEADETLRQASHTHIFPIVRGRVYMYLAAIQAQQQLKEARQTLENARVAFSAQSALAEVVPLYADCGDASLLLWDGLTHYYLGLKDSKQARQALISLSVSGQLQSGFANPERFRLECLNNRTLAAIQLNDLEEAFACIEAGRQGARDLESKQRMAETDYAYQLMLKQWPTEKRVKQLQGANVEQ
jgi:DNA-binding SARP family transcriptional activator